MLAKEKREKKKRRKWKGEKIILRSRYFTKYLVVSSVVGLTFSL